MRLLVPVGSGEVEVFRGGHDGGRPPVCLAHPGDAVVEGTLELVAEVAPDSEILGVNPRGVGGSSPAPPPSLESMVEDVEAARLVLGIRRCVFWGMSGGGWLGLLYARSFPASVAGLVVESACLCFRERLRDPACVLSPFHPAWREALTERGLLQPESHDAPSPGADTEWLELPFVGQVLRRHDGPALLVSPAPAGPAMQRIMPALWEFDARAWAGEIRAPTLVLGGTADPITPLAHARAVHAAIAGSAFAAIADAGHVPSAQRHPEALRAVREFVPAV
jgi:3-oxoadipate enol-lactonase/3-oxoadipate enol-lactonase/4-carboxymuconolactone decarboxylase